MEPKVITYGAYILISIFLTVWVARTLHKNGRVFLVEMFGGDEALADSVNHLLVVGFYLINFGYVTLALKLGYDVPNARGSIEAMLGTPVFLDLHVKIAKDWQRDPKQLQRLGF